MTRARRRAGVLAIPMIAAALSIAGCGDDSATTNSTGADSQQFQACLKEQGVELPGGEAPSGAQPTQPPSAQPPTGGIPGGINPQKMQKAFQACQQYAPQDAPSGGFPGVPPS